MTDRRTPREQVLKELGKFIEEKMFERESYLKSIGAIEKPMSRSQLAELLGVSRVWVSDIMNGNKVASDTLLLKIASVLKIDEHELFKVARRLHPSVYQQTLKDYLGDYYIDGMNE